MKLKRIKFRPMHLALLLLSIVVVLILPHATADAATKEEETALSEMKLIAENDALELYLDEKETDVAVRVKATGDLWFSNPIEAEKDPLASAYYQRLMKSQLSVVYFNEKVQKNEMDNYNSSIMDGQFTIQTLPDGVTITYTLGQMKSKNILPIAISEERYESYFNKMDEKTQKRVKRNYTHLVYSEMKEKAKDDYLALYPNLATMNLYVLKTGTKDYVIEELMGYFAQAGYTEEDMYSDMEAAGYVSEESNAWFQIPLTYRLSGDQLLVSVDPRQITYNEDGNYLAYINVLQYFGAADTSQNGYLFVPDGSGSLIRLNNGKTDCSAYYAQVYGTDLTSRYTYKTVSEADDHLSVKLPVYGLKTEEKAWFAIIEDGAAYANLNADVSGRTSSYNNIFAGFSYLDYGPISLNDVIGSNGFQMYGKPDFQGNYQICVTFLHGEDANYSGMARTYQKYLASQQILKKQNTSQSLPFYVDYIGAIDKLKSLFGFKYHSIEALTTYKQADFITDQLRAGGIENLTVSYSGWMNGGIHGTAPTKVKEVSKLSKGGMSLKKFMTQMEEKGVRVFHKVDFQNVYKDKLFDGYTANTYTARYFDNKLVKYGRVLIPNGFIIDRTILMLSPSYLDSVLAKFMKSAARLPLAGVNIGTMSTTLYSDYSKKAYSDRQASVRAYTEAMKTLDQTYTNGVLAENANDYTFAYASDILNVPMYSNEYRIMDEDVPFYEMVIKGYISYSGESLNLCQDYETTLLKSIETGAGLYFQWIYADNSVVKNTDYDSLYSVNYQSWLDKAVSDYKRANDALGSLSDQTIYSHEKIQNQVYQTTYESGTKVIVNYNPYPVTVNGIQIPAKDFRVRKVG